MTDKKLNLFEKIYCGWWQVLLNFEEWQWVLTHNETNTDFFLGLNLDIVKVIEQS